ncbi:MAG: hypothetical protein SPE16_08180, partial [Butyricicoccus porcorum]|nr:hypothetical protein [Butyricicoccus porcorum]
SWLILSQYSVSCNRMDGSPVNFSRTFHGFLPTMQAKSNGFPAAMNQMSVIPTFFRLLDGLYLQKMQFLQKFNDLVLLSSSICGILSR